MDPKDYEDYQKNNVKASKSQLKEYIQIYADMAKKLKSESAIELEAVKGNIKKTYPQEIYFTLVDELERPVKLTLTESSKEYLQTSGNMPSEAPRFPNCSWISLK